MKELLIHALTAPAYARTPADGVIVDTLLALAFALLCAALWAVLKVSDRKAEKEQESLTPEQRRLHAEYEKSKALARFNDRRN